MIISEDLKVGFGGSHGQSTSCTLVMQTWRLLSLQTICEEQNFKIYLRNEMENNSSFMELDSSEEKTSYF